jgi:hypothetical protein
MKIRKENKMALISGKGPTGFKTVNKMFLGEGTHIFQPVEPDAKEIYTHWITSQSRSVLCLNQDYDADGGDCPICQQNVRLSHEYGKDARERDGYYNRSGRYVLNVLDLTPVKRDSEGNLYFPDINGYYPPTADKSENKEILADVQPEPRNEVCLLEMSRTYASELDMMARQKEVPWTQLVYKASVKGRGKNKVTLTDCKLQESATLPEGQEISAPEFTFINFSADELADVLRGVSFKDLFNARKEAKETPSTNPEQLEEDAEASKEATATATRALEDILGGKW